MSSGATEHYSCLYHKADGVDHMVENDPGIDSGLTVPGEGDDKVAIAMLMGSLLQDPDPSTDSGQGRGGIHISNFKWSDPPAKQSFASFHFGQGSGLVLNDLLARRLRKVPANRRWRYGDRVPGPASTSSGRSVAS